MCRTDAMRENEPVRNSGPVACQPYSSPHIWPLCGATPAGSGVAE
jgi:hypothetical protein